ncbi:hypothetical protein F5Y15DRAFT_155649 [Xylariaceae sp. FL0016]|nr:hypothetical protein F5Y15DRAFT_155649 [Xylariaceae sp. FL0016]
MASEEQFTLLALGLIIIAIRVQVRWKAVGPSNWMLDDYLMPVAGIVFAMETVAAYLVGAMFDGLTNSYMTPEQRANLDPSSEEYYNRQWGSKIQIIGWSLYAFILWSLKICIAVFYSRLTSGLAHLRQRVIIAYVLLGVTYLVVALTLILSCQPMNHFWQISPDPGDICQPTKSPVYVFVILIPNILTDIYLLSIPLPLLWGVQIGIRRKITLMVLFSGAIFVIMAGTIRAVTILTAGAEGAVSGSQWACRETFVAIIVANLPIIQPLLRSFCSKIGLSALFSRTTRTGRSQSHPLDSKVGTDGFEMSKSRGNKSKRSQHPLSIPGTTAWASDEHILVEGNSGETSANGVKGPPPLRSVTGSIKDMGGIVVAQEITIRNDPNPRSQQSMEDPSRDDWGYGGAGRV